MRVIVASHNPVKLAAARAAFVSCFPRQDIDLSPVSAPSGVGEQPMTDSDTRQGALNRAASARRLAPAAEFWVGMEGGVALYDEQLTTFAWMAIVDKAGQISTARSVTLPLPGRVRAMVEAGYELGEANDRVFSTVNSKQQGGAFGLLTQGRYTRESVYTETLVIALVPFVNKLYP